MKNKKTMRFRVSGFWSEWGDYGSMKLPNEVDAVEFSEYMTVKEMKEKCPEWYKDFIARYGERNLLNDKTTY